MDEMQEAFEVIRLRNLILVTFGVDQGSELIELADKMEEKSGLAPNRTLELSYQIGEEFGAQASDVFDEMYLWVSRTAVSHHPHTVGLYLKALAWVILKRRASV